MNSEAHAMTNCPGDESLAAFVEGKLNGAARQDVLTHMADCADCREVVLIASDAVAAEAPAAKVVTGRFDSHRFLPLLAAAAALVVLFGIPSIRERILPGGAMGDVREAAASFEMRQTEARTTLDGPHKAFKGTMRGAEAPAEIEADAALFEARRKAERRATPENLHALGLAYLLAGNRKEAVVELKRAASQGASADLLNDLAAAHVERGDYADALTVADRALQLERSPAGLWNRALALERLGRDQEAIAGWEQYIALETDPAWDEEAREKLRALR